MHNAPSIDQSKKKKLCVIHFYNKNKVGVDVVGQMLRQYSTHTASRRRPFAEWTNILDIAALNLLSCKNSIELLVIFECPLVRATSSIDKTSEYE